MHDSLTTLAVITVAFIVAGVVKGIIGMGLPTVAIGMLGLVMAPVQAVAILVIPSLVTNLWLLAVGPNIMRLLVRFGLMLSALFFGSICGVILLTNLSRTMANMTLGTVLIAYGIFGLRAATFSVTPRWQRWLSPLVGLSTGLLSGATGLALIPAVPYLNSIQLDKNDLIQTLGLTFTVSTLGIAVGLAMNGQYQVSAAGNSIFAIFPALGGMFIGQAVRNRMKPEVFRYWFFIGIITFGAYMVLRTLI